MKKKSMTLTPEEIEMIEREAGLNATKYAKTDFSNPVEIYTAFCDCYTQTATKYLLQLKSERERAGKLEDIVQKLSDWSKKYPRGPIYPMSKKTMDDELIQIEELAKATITEYKKTTNDKEN